VSASDWRDSGERGHGAVYRRGVAISGAEGGRIAAAGAAGRSFGIAAECGFGRLPPGTVADLLGLHRAVLDAS
jgi:hypothetical protein